MLRRTRCATPGHGQAGRPRKKASLQVSFQVCKARYGVQSSKKRSTCRRAPRGGRGGGALAGAGRARADSGWLVDCAGDLGWVRIPLHGSPVTIVKQALCFTLRQETAAPMLMMTWSLGGTAANHSTHNTTNSKQRAELEPAPPTASQCRVIDSSLE